MNKKSPKTEHVAPGALSPDVDAQLQSILGKTDSVQAAAQDAVAAVPEELQHCGLVAIVGRPNVGKSTLLNALVGQKISITSRKAQTTRHRIMGIRTRDAHQFVFVDTPGFQTRHGNALNKSLNKAVAGAVAGVDVVLLVVEAGRFGAGDARVLELLPPDVPVLLVASKLDTGMAEIVRQRLARVLAAQDKTDEALALLAGDAVPAFVAGREELRGDLLVRLGRKAEARTAYEKARAAMPQDAGLGVLQTKLDDLADKEA